MKVYVWIVTLCASFSALQAQNCKKETRCRISRIHGMKGADCYKKEIREFPQCLPSDVEIIDLSTNRVRKLSTKDLKKYSYLQMLYLHDNVILTIDEGAFEGKDDLNTLDLSLNGISKLPSVVFHLPSLKSLYLGQNLNINIAEVVEKAKPVTSPLIHLDISYVMTEDPSDLPEFGMLPLLTKYNISGNKLASATPKHFAGLCNLKILDTTNVTTEYDQPCDCWTLNRWLKSRQVQFKPFECEINENECWDAVPPEDLQLYDECKKQAEAIVKKSQLLKILIPVVVGVALLALIICFVIRRKRRQKKLIKKLKEEETLYENEMHKT